MSRDSKRNPFAMPRPLPASGNGSPRDPREDTFVFDFGDTVSFLAFNDIREVGLDPSLWPRVTKEIDGRKEGLLKSGMSMEPNRVQAAKAYAAMSGIGSTKAVAAAARWLGLPSQTSSAAFERQVLAMLRKVEEREANTSSTAVTVSYMPESDLKATEMETKAWMMGVTGANRVAASKVMDVCIKSREGWIAAALGGRSMGFSDGEYEFMIVNNSMDAASAVILNMLTGLSKTQDSIQFDSATGLHLQVRGVQVGDNIVNIDFLFPKAGYSALALCVKKGNCWATILKGAGVMQFFQALRHSATNADVIGGPVGKLSQYVVMIAGLETLFEKGLLTLSLSRPLVDQQPRCESIEKGAVDTLVRETLAVLARRLLDEPDRVLGSFDYAMRWSERGHSEFSGSTALRVCRDPFGIAKDNLLKNVINPETLRTVAKRLRHAAICEHQVPHSLPSNRVVPPATDMATMDTLKAGVVRKVKSPTELEQRVDSIGLLKICVITNCDSYGVSTNETDARLRAINNTEWAPAENLYVEVGQTLTVLAEGRPDAAWILTHFNQIWTGTVPDQPNIWFFGACETDAVDESVTLHPITQFELETVLSHMSKMPAEDEPFSPPGMGLIAETGGM